MKKKESLSVENIGSSEGKLTYFLGECSNSSLDLSAIEAALTLVQLSQSDASLTNYSLEGSTSGSVVGPNNNNGSVSLSLRILGPNNKSRNNNSTQGGTISLRILGPKKKSAKRKNPKKEGRTKPLKKRKNNVEVLEQQQQHVELPTAFQEKIQELEGSEVKLVLQKKLFASDVNHGLSRFSIPITKIREEAKNFLTPSEESSLDDREGDKMQYVHSLQVLVLDPCLNQCNLQFKKWPMKTTQVYNITSSGWNDLVRNNDLKEDDEVQLWSFRSKNHELCFALVKVPKDCGIIIST